MISSKLTLLLLPILFLAMVQAQAEGETNTEETKATGFLTCEEQRDQNSWTQERYDTCVENQEKLRKGVADLASGLGKAAVGFDLDHRGDRHRCCLLLWCSYWSHHLVLLLQEQRKCWRRCLMS